jgi:hypothetical protein
MILLRKKMNDVCLLVSIMLLFSSCSPKITYKTADITVSERSELKKFTVSLSVSEDLRRKESPDKNWIFSDDYKNKIECYNLERDYIGVSVPVEIKKSIALHLYAKKNFREVYIDSIDAADFQVNIQLKSFAGRTSVSYKALGNIASHARIGLLWGILAIVAPNEFRSDLSYTIDYGTITILDRKRCISLPTFRYYSSGKIQIPAMIDCYQIYNHLNSILKTHNDTFVELIASTVGEYLKSSMDTDSEDVVE